MVFLNAYSTGYKRSYFNVQNVMSEKHGVTDKSCLREEKVFKDVLLVPGAGHMEKNLLLVIFVLCQNIFLEHLVDLLRCRTKNSWEFVMNCGNCALGRSSTYHMKHFSRSLLECMLLRVYKKRSLWQAIILFNGETIK